MSEQIQQAIQQLRAAIGNEPASAKARFRANTTSAEDSFSTTASVRGFKVLLDEPAELGGANTGPNPVEAVLAALGSCQAIVYRAYANALGLRIDRVDVEARGFLDLRGFLGDSAVPAGFERVTFSTRISSPESAERIAELAKTVEAHCPVLDILRRTVPVAGELEHVHTSTVTGTAARDAA